MLFTSRRPHPESRSRWIFNWTHWFIGNSAHVIGEETLILTIGYNRNLSWSNSYFSNHGNVLCHWAGKGQSGESGDLDFGRLRHLPCFLPYCLEVKKHQSWATWGLGVSGSIMHWNGFLILANFSINICWAETPSATDVHPLSGKWRVDLAKSCIWSLFAIQADLGQSVMILMSAKTKGEEVVVR